MLTVPPLYAQISSERESDAIKNTMCQTGALGETVETDDPYKTPAMRPLGNFSYTIIGVALKLRHSILSLDDLP